MIYFDNASTTKICATALDYYNLYASEKFFNASAIYKQGIEIRKSIDAVKREICNLLGVEFKNNIIFTGSATEANNLAFLGSYKKNFGRIVVSEGEHACVYNSALNLKNKGAEVVFVPLAPNGEIDYEKFENALTTDTSFISVMHVSNETGAINDLNKLISIKNRICPKAIFHSDGVQAFGKIKFNLNENVDLYTISAHKIHGPKGVGALYVKNKTKLNAIIFGGGQEYNLRSGTENIAGIMGFKGAIEEISFDNNIQEIKKEFIAGLKGDFKINGDRTSPYILSLSYKGLNGETLVHMLEEQNILISRGSACSGTKTGNRILSSMKLDKSLVQGSIRISFSRYNTTQEAQIVAKNLNDCVARLREI